MKQTRVGCVFYVSLSKCGFWFRVFGRGLSIGLDEPVLFSERHGFRKVYRWRRWSFEVLK